MDQVGTSRATVFVVEVEVVGKGGLLVGTVAYGEVHWQRAKLSRKAVRDNFIWGWSMTSGMRIEKR
jgi:hypothetical protein